MSNYLVLKEMTLKRTWKLLNQSLNKRNANNNSQSTSLEINNQIIINSQQIFNEFNQFFHTCWTQTEDITKNGL